MAKTQREAVVRAAMAFAKPWMDGERDSYIFAGNKGLLAKLVRACARYAKSNREGKR